MPIFRHRRVVKLGRKAKAFLNLEAGVTRGAVPKLIRAVGDASPDGRTAAGVAPENIVWIFGTGRTGSTWLAAMMEEPEGHNVWFEPRVGAFVDPRRFERYGGTHFVLSPQYKEVWLGSIRNFVLDGANARFPDLADGGYLIVKEPGGSEGSQVLVEALPESRMVLLVRDPRDVVSSWLDAAKTGSWRSERRGNDTKKADLKAETNPNAFVKRHAEAYLRNVRNAKKAYETHEGYKVLVRYEDLRADTLGTMRHLYSALEIAVNEQELSRAVQKHSWENIPEEQGDSGWLEGRPTAPAREGDGAHNVTGSGSRQG